MTSTQEIIENIVITDEPDIVTNANIITLKPNLPYDIDKSSFMTLDSFLSYALFSDRFNFTMEDSLTLLQNPKIFVTKNYAATTTEIIPTTDRLPERDSNALIKFWQGMCEYERKSILEVNRVVNWCVRYITSGPDLDHIDHDVSIQYLGYSTSHMSFAKYLTESNFSEILHDYIVRIFDETTTKDTLRAYLKATPSVHDHIVSLCHCFLIANASEINQKIVIDEEMTYSWTVTRPCTTITSRNVNPNKWILTTRSVYAFMRFMHMIFSPISPDPDTESEFVQKRIPDNTDQTTSEEQVSALSNGKYLPYGPMDPQPQNPDPLDPNSEENESESEADGNQEELEVGGEDDFISQGAASRQKRSIGSGIIKPFTPAEQRSLAQLELLAKKFQELDYN